MFSIKKNSYFFIAITLIIYHFSINSCLGQTKQVHFEHITTEEGLSQNDINCIYQDSKGFIWLGTHDGLNKYNGYDFEIYMPQPNDPQSISSNLVYDISGGKNDILWIGTTGKGINIFDPKTENFTQIRHDPLDTNSLLSDHIYTLSEDSRGRLWVGTNRGLCMWEEAGIGTGKPVFRRLYGEKALEMGLTGDHIHAIYEDETGVLWFGSTTGLFKLEESNNNFHFSKYHGGDLASNIFITSILKDPYENLIITTNTGLFYEKEKGKFKQLTSGTFEGLILDRNKHVWAGSRQGIYRLSYNRQINSYQIIANYQNDVFVSHSLNKNLIKSLFVDKTGIIWIGTNGGGINKVDPGKKAFRHFKKDLLVGSLNYNKIRSIFEDSHGTLWIGTEGGGLNYQLAKDGDGNYQHFQTLFEPTNIFALNEVSIKGKPHLMVGAAEANPGLYQLELNQSSKYNKEFRDIKQLEEVNGSVFACFKSKTGKIWVGTYAQGLFCLQYDDSAQDYEIINYQHDPQDASSLSSNIIRSITEDKEGNLWIGTGAGLNKLPLTEQNQAKPSFIAYKYSDKAHSISHNYILSLYYSAKEELWIGTFGGGLNKYISTDDSFEVIGTKDGLPNDVIKGILEDDHGKLWLASNKGLTKFDPETGGIINYDTNDGLQSNEFSELACLRRKNGEMIFGGVNGFNAFFPDSIKDNQYIPDVVLTNFQILNKPVEVGESHNGRIILKQSISELDNLNLKHNENSFSFEFSALHYAAPQKNQYAFKLEGFEDKWVHVSSERRFANYTNLRHGTYRFMVKASNNDGRWNETPTVLHIKIAPPFWLTWWAYALYFLISILLLIAFRRYTIIGINEKHQLILKNLEKEQAEELQKLKLRFFTNISHEIRTPLTLIAGPMDQLIKKSKQLNEKQIHNHYRLIKRNTDYLLRLINQLLDFRKIDQGKMQLNATKDDLVLFIREIMEPFQFLANKKQIHYTFHTQFRELSAYFDKDIIEKALYNLLSNAFKFTSDKGNISIHLSVEAKSDRVGSSPRNFARIDVEDTGSGIPITRQKIIFDRFFKESKKSHQNKEGTGIGLAFTKSLIELHKGQIGVKSEEGKGSCFSIMIPIDQHAYPEVQDDLLNKLEEISKSKTYVTTGLTQNDETLSNKSLPLLLIVDDHEDIRYYIKSGFKEFYRIIEAENGEEGFKKAQNELPDLIISDVMMPKMNGIEMCQQLKNDSITSHIPIIILTAKASEENELKGLQSGADDYLRKPFSPEILHAKIQNIIAHKEELHKRFKREVLLDPSEITVTSADELFLKDAVSLIEMHMDNPEFNVEEMVHEIGMSRSKLYLKVKALTGQSTSEFIRTIRLKRAVQLFEQSDHSVKEIMYMTGFSTASYFSKCFKKQFGMTPTEFVNKKKGVKTEK